MTIAAAGEYDLSPIEIPAWQASNKVVVDLSSGDLSIGDGVTYKTSAAEAVKYLLGALPAQVSVDSQPVFASKKIGTKKLYTRATGKTFSLAVGDNTLDFTVIFDVMKFNGVEIDKAEAGEKINLKVLDTAAGLLSGVPNYVLNQFGYDINLPDGHYRLMSAYDADLIKDLQIRIEYNALSARTIGVNYMLHELKT